MVDVMVVVGSRHGATRGIGDRIAETLRAEGFVVGYYDAAEAPSPQSARAVVIGGAAYMNKWVDEVPAYIRRHHAELAGRRVWLFSSGPVGTDKVDKQGRDVLEPPRFLTDAASDLGAKGTQVFFGRWDPDDPPTNVAERLFRMLPVSKELLPIGDFRDWPAIEGWAREIAKELRAEAVATA
jgi:menaquinone-dependent protoporphyrinogen oxidase